MKTLRNSYLIAYENGKFIDLTSAITCIDEVTAKNVARMFNENEGYSEHDFEMHHKEYFIREIETVA